MTTKKMWVAGLAIPVMIAMVLLFAGSPSVAANDQPSAASAEVKIDNFSFWAADAHGFRRSDGHMDQP